MVHNIMNPGSKYYGCEILNPPSSYILKGRDSEYYGCDTMTHFWFSLLGGGGSKYYGCEISNPLTQYTIRVGIHNIVVARY
jgi:hypothetical protein